MPTLHFKSSSPCYLIIVATKIVTLLVIEVDEVPDITVRGGAFHSAMSAGNVYAEGLIASLKVVIRWGTLYRLPREVQRADGFSALGNAGFLQWCFYHVIITTACQQEYRHRNEHHGNHQSRSNMFLYHNCQFKIYITNSKSVITLHYPI